MRPRNRRERRANARVIETACSIPDVLQEVTKNFPIVKMMELRQVTTFFRDTIDQTYNGKVKDLVVSMNKINNKNNDNNFSNQILNFPVNYPNVFSKGSAREMLNELMVVTATGATFGLWFGVVWGCLTSTSVDTVKERVIHYGLKGASSMSGLCGFLQLSIGNSFTQNVSNVVYDAMRNTVASSAAVFTGASACGITFFGAKIIEETRKQNLEKNHKFLNDIRKKCSAVSTNIDEDLNDILNMCKRSAI